jgi:hypothetical protein
MHGKQKSTFGHPKTQKMPNVIPALVEQLRKYNSEMGDYHSNIINEHLNHVVRFSNGLLEVPKELYEDYKASRITEDQLNSLAHRFKKYELM